MSIRQRGKLSVPNLIILLVVYSGWVEALEFGEICIRGPSDTCDKDKLLLCNVEGLFGWTCGCDEAKGLEDPRNPGICLPFPINVGDDCQGFVNGDLTICQQIPGAVCNGTVCVCSAEYFQFGTTCVKYMNELHGQCSNPRQCDLIPAIGGSFCALPPGVCLCRPNTHLEDINFSKCLAFCTRMGESCEATTGNQCVNVGEGVICNSTNVCGCDSANGYFLYPDGTRCFKSAGGLGDACEVGAGVCAAIEGAECNASTKICECDLNHVTHPNNQQCLPFINNLDTTCVPNTVPDQCSRIPGANCHSIQSRCLCDENHFQVGTVCQPLPTSPMEPCNTNAHCAGIPNTICTAGRCTCDSSFGWEFSNSTCQCSPSSIPSSNGIECLPIVQNLQGLCRETLQCQSGIGENSVCLAGRCNCQANYIPYLVDGMPDRCLTVAPVNGSCEVKAQCVAAMGQEAECIQGQCACNINSGFMNNQCIPIVLLDGRCTRDEECILGSNINARCYNNICQCIPGKVPVNGKCYGSPLINDECVDTEECRFSINGTVTCTQGICRCRSISDASHDLSTCGGMNCRGSVFVNLTVFLAIVSIPKFMFKV